jgi:anaerobic selenocysteine-containing dehydrogenase
MTNDWVDIRNSDCILVIGGNPAENHPASILWVNKAREQGAKLIVVDPRFNRTAAVADFYAPLRSGTDIVFLGGLIYYTLQNRLYNEEYVKYYTNALTLINPDYKGPADLDGYFSGFNAEKQAYDSATWQYQTEKQKVVGSDGKEVEVTVIKRAASLDEPNTVFAHLRSTTLATRQRWLNASAARRRTNSWRSRNSSAPPARPTSPVPSSTPWARRSIPSARRT